jgi:hypothetical protein
MGVFSSVFCVFDRKMISSPLLALRLLLRGPGANISFTRINSYCMLRPALTRAFLVEQAWRFGRKNNIPAFPLASDGTPTAKEIDQVLLVTEFQLQHPRCRK